MKKDLTQHIQNENTNDDNIELLNNKLHNQNIIEQFKNITDIFEENLIKLSDAAFKCEDNTKFEISKELEATINNIEFTLQFLSAGRRE